MVDGSRWWCVGWPRPGSILADCAAGLCRKDRCRIGKVMKCRECELVVHEVMTTIVVQREREGASLCGMDGGVER